MGVSQQVLAYVTKLTPGAHAVFFYDTIGVAAQIFAAYVKGGVERNEAAYIVSPSRDVYAHFAKLGGINLAALEKRGCLNYASLLDFCSQDGHLSSKKLFANAQTLLRGVSEFGFKGSRLIILADNLLEHASPQELVRFERELGETLPLSAICSYDAGKVIDRGGYDLLIDLLQAHGHVIFEGLASPRTEESRSKLAIATST